MIRKNCVKGILYVLLVVGVFGLTACNWDENSGTELENSQIVSEISTEENEAEELAETEKTSEELEKPSETELPSEVTETDEEKSEEAEKPSEEAKPVAEKPSAETKPVEKPSEEAKPAQTQPAASVPSNPAPAPAEVLLADIAFDTPFEIKAGETFTVGREEISITFPNIFVDEYSCFAPYILEIDGQQYEGVASEDYVDGTKYVDQEFFTENRVRIESSTEDSVIITITEDTVAPEPLVLDGNKETLYEVTAPTYVESENFVLYLCEGCKVPGDTAVYFEEVIKALEEITGWSFYNDSVYANLRSNDRELLYGQDTFAGVNADRSKIDIFIIPLEEGEPYAAVSGVVLDPIDLERGEWALPHELSHLIQSRNTGFACRAFTEGFATYTTQLVDEKYPELGFIYDPEFNYEGYPIEITAENAESEFVGIKEDTWHDYLYGYKFSKYLSETYGEDILVKIYESAAAKVEVYYFGISDEQLIETIKEETSETVFEDFGNLTEF